MDAENKKTKPDTKPRRQRPQFTDQEALEFHSRGRPGKLEIMATKPMATQRDLSLIHIPSPRDSTSSRMPSSA